jgi:hypothetical protein
MTFSINSNVLFNRSKLLLSNSICDFATVNLTPRPILFIPRSIPIDAPLQLFKYPLTLPHHPLRRPDGSLATQFTALILL